VFSNDSKLKTRSSGGVASANPITEFLSAVERATARGVDTAPVALATADATGRPSVRMVLLRGADAHGFVFHTNYTSRKARELAENPHAAICVHWQAIEEQIRIEGTVERLDDRTSDDYFATRPRGSQIGAWASRQSATLGSREALEEEYRAVEQRFDGWPVPRPPFWGGFRLIPERIEFWFGRADRLHDRLLYLREGDGWRIERLYP
jgi:pyridoxamine 5'-phosphate oxidase